MAISFYNELKVHGSRNNLLNFIIDIAGNRENGPLSFKNIIPELQNISKWDAFKPEMQDKGEFLVYTFGTRRSAPVGIYGTLIEKYSELDFDIYYSDDCTFSFDELASRKGKLTKNYCSYWKTITCKNGKSKDMLYRKDLINNTINVVEEHIFYPGEYDEGSHRWLTKDVEFSEVNGVAIYESMSSEENLKLRSEVNHYDSSPVEGTCMCCGRHISELCYSRKDNSEKALLIKVDRPMYLPDEEDEKALDKSEGQNDPLDRLIEDYQDADLFEELKESWECRDCAVLDTDEYFEKRLRRR